MHVQCRALITTAVITTELNCLLLKKKKKNRQLRDNVTFAQNRPNSWHELLMTKEIQFLSLKYIKAPLRYRVRIFFQN